MRRKGTKPQTTVTMVRLFPLAPILPHTLQVLLIGDSTVVGTGADFLRGIAAQYALDLSHVVATGHSAGGHLALWLAGRHRLPAASPLSVATALPMHGVVSLAGIPDLVEGVKRHLARGMCQELVGGVPTAVPQRYQQASPRALLPLGVPQWHIVGHDDQSVPVDYVQQYVAVARHYDPVQLDILPEVGHFELVVPSNRRGPPCDTRCSLSWREDSGAGHGCAAPRQRAAWLCYFYVSFTGHKHDLPYYATANVV